MPTTLRKSADPLAAKADLLVVCVASPPALAGPAAAVDAALGGVVARAVKDGEVDGKARSSTVFHAASGLAAPRVAVVGIGGGGADDWRAAGSAAAGAAARARAGSVALAPPPEAGAAEVAALLEGFGTGIYRFDRYKTTDEAKQKAPRVRRVAVHSAASRTRATCAAPTASSRRSTAPATSSNTPSNHLTPTDLAEHAKALADATPGLTCTVLGRARLEKLGAGALLGVAQGLGRAAAADRDALPPRGRPAPARCSAWWARRSRSTAAASPSSPRAAWRT